VCFGLCHVLSLGSLNRAAYDANQGLGFALRIPQKSRKTQLAARSTMAEFFHPYLGERIMARRFAVALIWVIWVTSCLAQNKNAVDVVRMEQIIDSYVPKQFMGTVLVAEDGKILLDKGYGFANLEWQVPNTPTTKFRLASITKQFTAASILLLEESGKLKVEDPVKKYMPDAPAAWDKITIFNLLTHTSGIPNFTDFRRKNWWRDSATSLSTSSPERSGTTRTPATCCSAI
jgi:CubicO group peptidase (beta-lactamase class C family)